MCASSVRKLNRGRRNLSSHESRTFEWAFSDAFGEQSPIGVYGDSHIFWGEVGVERFTHFWGVEVQKKIRPMELSPPSLPQSWDLENTAYLLFFPTVVSRNLRNASRPTEKSTWTQNSNHPTEETQLFRDHFASLTAQVSEFKEVQNNTKSRISCIRVHVFPTWINFYLFSFIFFWGLFTTEADP